MVCASLQGKHVLPSIKFTERQSIARDMAYADFVESAEKFPMLYCP